MYTDKLTRKEARALTPEQKIERKKAYYQLNKDSHKANVSKYYQKNKESIATRKKAYYQKNKESIAAKKKIQQKLKYDNSITSYVVYKHTNDTGAVYIGAGNNLRPYQFYCNHRKGGEWHNHFTKDNVTVEILHTFDTRDEAMSKESELIRSIGLENLVNTRLD